jgi:hypothetical protein
MKLIKSPKLEFNPPNLGKMFREDMKNPVRAYGDYLYREYVDKNRPDLQLWGKQNPSNCLMCKAEDDGRDDEHKGIFSCDRCAGFENEEFALYNKSHEQAKMDFHKLTEVKNIMKLDRKAREAE